MYIIRDEVKIKLTENRNHLVLLKVRELDGKMENLSMEVKDFEGAVKLQSALLEKQSASRAADPEGKDKKEKKMTETQRAMLEAKIMQVNI